MKRIWALLTLLLILPILPIIGVEGLVQGLVGSLLGGALGGARQNAVPARVGFRSYVSVEDGDGDYNTPAEVYGAIGAVGVWAKIWEMTVPAQQMFRWGYGSPALPDNQGYMWFAILDKTTDWSVGFVRLEQANARETRHITVAEIPDSQLHSTTLTTIATAALLDRKEMIALPEKVEYPLVGEDSLLQIWYKLVTAATAADEANFRIPVTVYQ